jgi:hypothetical protein
MEPDGSLPCSQEPTTGPYCKSDLSNPYRFCMKFCLKVKVNVSLCFNWAPCHEGVSGSGGMAPLILDLGTSWRWVINLTPLPLYPRERIPGTNYIWVCVGSRAGLDTVSKTKIPIPRRESNPARPGRSKSLYLLSYAITWSKSEAIIFEVQYLDWEYWWNTLSRKPVRLIVSSQ